MHYGANGRAPYGHGHVDGLEFQNHNQIGAAEDVAPIVAFLASPAARWINGQVIRVNGVSRKHFVPHLISAF